MLFNSIEFLIFFPLVTLFCFVLPQKARLYWLLVASYVFYMGWNVQYALLLFFSTAVTFASGLLIGHAKDKQQQRQEAGTPGRNTAKLWVALSVIINLSILFFFKYFSFAVDSINSVLRHFGRGIIEPGFSVLLPVGISFYIFQALSYTFDVYRGDVRVEKNFFKYAVFVSFFPQLVAGPIERSSNLLTQFDKPILFNAKKLRDGLQLMLWGFFLKLVIADRASIAVNQVFNYASYYSGFEVLVGALLFAVQIYGDFAGYSCIAIGAARVLGFDLMPNFRRPYFSRSVAEFWRRWHISLSGWFRDYLYIPLGGNRKGKVRQYINIMIVFLCSGLWHGSAWNYVLWGGLNGAYQVIGSIAKPLRERVMHKTKMRTDTFSHRLLQTLITFLLVDLSWIFFRANSIESAFRMIGSLFTWNPWVLTDGTLLNIGFTSADWLILAASLVILFIVSLLQERGLHLNAALEKQEHWFQWAVLIAGLMFVLMFGIYGPGFDSASFIYFQF